MSKWRYIQYPVLAVLGFLACYVVAFHGFGAVAKGVLLQTQPQADLPSHDARRGRLVVPLI